MQESAMKNDDIVEMSIGDLIDAFAEALKVVGKKAPAFKKGDRVVITGTVTGLQNGHANINVDGVNKHPNMAFPVGALKLDEVA
jgi:hypothetical protein